MTTEDQFNGKNYITAQILIKADDFAREMIGEDITTQKLEDFIRNNASLMDFVYGSAVICEPTDVPYCCQKSEMDKRLIKIEETVDSLELRLNYLADKIVSEMLFNTDFQISMKPWWKRILGL